MKSENRNESRNLKEKRELEKKEEMRTEIISWIRMFVIVIVVVLVATKFIIINATIPSGSMENTIMTKDRLIGFRFSYWFSDPERGDIVLFSYPVDEKKTYIKRVIGLPGETVEIRNGEVFIDGSDTPLTENYLHEEWYYKNDGFYFVVPEDSYFMMGDNRNNSADGREWADEALAAGVASTEEEAYTYSFVNKKKIKGKAIFTYFRHFRILQHSAVYDEE